MKTLLKSVLILAGLSFSGQVFAQEGNQFTLSAKGLRMLDHNFNGNIVLKTHDVGVFKNGVSVGEWNEGEIVIRGVNPAQDCLATALPALGNYTFVIETKKGFNVEFVVGTKGPRLVVPAEDISICRVQRR